MRDRATLLTADLDWSGLAQRLRSRKLLSTLGPRISEFAEERATDDFKSAVDHAIQAGRRQGEFLQLVALRIMTTLSDTEIRCTALKGPLLGEAIYGEPGRRLSSDIDLLVPPDRLSQAVEVVRQLGYAAPSDYVQRDGLPQLHFRLLHLQEKLPPVELHWRIHWYEREYASDCLLPPQTVPSVYWRPAPADELLALLLYYARDGFVDLRLASDLSAWWDVRGVELQPGALDERLRLYPALDRVVRTAAKAAEQVVGLPAHQIFVTQPKFGVRSRIAVRLANPNPCSSPAQIYADIGLIDGLLSPPGGLVAFVRRQLLLPREVLDQLDRRAPKRRARSTLSRSVGMLGRYALAIVRASVFGVPDRCAEEKRMAGLRPWWTA